MHPKMSSTQCWYSTAEFFILQLGDTSIKCNLTQDEAVAARVPAASLPTEELSVSQRCARC